MSEEFHPLCKECAGACCSSWPIPHNNDQELISLVAGRTLTISGPDLHLNCQCSHLTPQGTCGIYSTRPDLCRTFQPRGPDCLRTLKALRPHLYQIAIAHSPISP